MFFENEEAIPKDLVGFMGKISNFISVEHGISEDISKEVIIGTLSWFMVSVGKTDSPEEMSKFMDTLNSDLKKEGMKVMLKSMLNKVDSEQYADDLMKKFMKD